jgi:hypothetical protein
MQTHHHSTIKADNAQKEEKMTLGSKFACRRFTNMPQMLIMETESKKTFLLLRESVFSAPNPALSSVFETRMKLSLEQVFPSGVCFLDNKKPISLSLFPTTTNV